MKSLLRLMESPLDTVIVVLLQCIIFYIPLVMGKSEGEGKDWHGHVTALTVAPDYRRLGIGQELMNHLENVSEAGDMNFVDLFVRESNSKACQMYKKMGYSTYRTITGYYTGSNPEDALDMRKPLSRDFKRESLVTDKTVISVEELYGE